MDASAVENMVVVVEERLYRDEESDSDSDSQLNMTASVSLAVTPEVKIAWADGMKGVELDRHHVLELTLGARIPGLIRERGGMRRGQGQGPGPGRGELKRIPQEEVGQLEGARGGADEVTNRN